jgi:hypothetical protein
MPDEPTKQIPINELHQEDGAHELASSPNMEPYINLIMAEMQESDGEANWKSSEVCHSKSVMSGGWHLL